VDEIEMPLGHGHVFPGSDGEDFCLFPFGNTAEEFFFPGNVLVRSTRSGSAVG